MNSASIFEYIQEQVVGFHPELRQTEFSLYYIDEEKDQVTFSSSDEIAAALQIPSASLFRIYVQIMKSNEETTVNNKVVHENIVCDICKNEIIGARYKCLICDDYDLCNSCVQLECHSDHEMIILRRQKLTFNASQRESLMRNLNLLFDDIYPDQMEYKSLESKSSTCSGSSFSCTTSSVGENKKTNQNKASIPRTASSTKRQESSEGIYIDQWIRKTPKVERVISNENHSIDDCREFLLNMGYNVTDPKLIDLIEQSNGDLEWILETYK